MSPAKRTLVAIAAVVFAAAAGAALLVYRWHRPLPGASVATMPDLLAQLPADAPVLGYIDVVALKRLQGSPLATVLGLAGENPRGDREYENFVRDTGFDYTRDLDRAAIAFWPSDAPTTSHGAAENRTVAIADGRFDEAKIRAYALRTGKTVAAGERSLYIVPGDPLIALEFLAPTRLALASGPDAAAMLSVPTSSSRNAAMQERISRVAGAPIFAVARTDHLPPSFYDDLRSVPQFETLAPSVKGLTLAGQPDGNIIHVTLDAECDSMANAVALTTVVDSLRLLASIALTDPKTRRQMTKEQLAFINALLNQARLSHQDRWVRLTLDVTPAMLGKSDSGPNAQMRHFDATYAAISWWP